MSDYKRYLVLILLALLPLFLFWQLPGAHAQGPVTPPPPVTTPPPPINPVDQANAEAAQWQAVANAAVASAQASINQAYASLAAAQAGVNQYRMAYQQAEAARQAAVRGQLQAAQEYAQAAQISGVQALALSSEASRSAMVSIREAGTAMRQVPELRSALTSLTAQRDTERGRVTQLTNDLVRLDKDRTALAGALVAERQRSDLYGKMAVAALLMLVVTMIYIAVVLAKLVRALHVKKNDRVVVLNERGQVTAQIEALS